MGKAGRVANLLLNPITGLFALMAMTTAYGLLQSDISDNLNDCLRSQASWEVEVVEAKLDALRSDVAELRARLSHHTLNTTEIALRQPLTPDDDAASRLAARERSDKLLNELANDRNSLNPVCKKIEPLKTRMDIATPLLSLVTAIWAFLIGTFYQRKKDAASASGPR